MIQRPHLKVPCPSQTCQAHLSAHPPLCPNKITLQPQDLNIYSVQELATPQCVLKGEFCKASCFGSAQDSTWRKVAKCCAAFAKTCPHFHLEIRNAIFITRDDKYARPTPAHFGVKSSLAVHVERQRAVSSVKKACERPSQHLIQQF